MSEGLAQVLYIAARAEVEPMTLRIKGADLYQCATHASYYLRFIK